MTLDDLKAALASGDMSFSAGAAPVVLQQKDTSAGKAGTPHAAPAVVVTRCYWNTKTHEILDADEEDLGPDYVEAVALMIAW